MTSITTTRRERARAATVTEIKETALRLMRESGTSTFRFADIAREMEVTAPALYRYFPSRDELLTALVADSWDGLAAELTAAAGTADGQPPIDRLRSVSLAYRNWARAEPERFWLLFGLPVPGYIAPAGGPTDEASERAFQAFFAVTAAAQGDADALGRLRPVPPTLAGELAVEESGIDPQLHQAMLHAWAVVHGIVALELHGQFTCYLSPAAVDELFAGAVDAAAEMVGIAAPAPLPARAPAE
ncbi:MAG: TetR/AcrR family transcriptional regulator [Actinomycetota bacterium]|nr:TetR/AcrR family transcriptional regulator [Actinomycetota bacterium]